MTDRNREYENSTFLASEREGIVYEIQYDDVAEVRSMLSHAPGIQTYYLLEWLEGESWDVDVVPLETDRADAAAVNAIRNFDGVGSD